MKYLKFTVSTSFVPPYKELVLHYKHLRIDNLDNNPIQIYLQSELIAEIEGFNSVTFLDFNTPVKLDKYYKPEYDAYYQGRILKIVPTTVNQIVKVYNYGN